MARHHDRVPTYPLAHAVRRKPRRWPLVLRFVKGAVHGAIVFPVVTHCLFTILIVYLDLYVGNLGLPPTIIPSLSIVVGLMLVFRNQTSYDRFWTGRHCLTSCVTSIRNLTRMLLVNARSDQPAEDFHSGNGATASSENGLPPTVPVNPEKLDTERTIRILLAILYAMKNNLRNEFRYTSTFAHASSLSSSSGSLANTLIDASQQTNDPVLARTELDLASLLPPGLVGFEDLGLGLPVQLTVMVESFIRRGFKRGWWPAPLASQLTTQLSNLIDAYGKMETIRTTPIPVAHLIHQKQVLALFVGLLPFSMVDDFGWWTVLIVAVVSFTLYGIEGIGSQLEDPFGYDKNDIKMDGVIEDARQEVMTLLEEYMSDGAMFN